MHVFTLPTRGDFYGEVHTLAVTSDGRGLRAAVGYRDGPHRMVSWDLAEDKATRRENVVTDGEHGLCWPPPRFAPDFAVMLFGNCVKRAGKKRRVTLEPPADAPRSWDYCEPGAVTPDGAFAVGGVNSVYSEERWPVLVWDLADAFAPGREELPACRTLLMPEGEPAHQFAVARGGVLGVLANGATLHRYRFDTFEPLPMALLPGEGDYASRLVALPGGDGFAAANKSGVHLVGDGDSEPRLTVGGGPVRDFAFTLDGGRLVTATPKGGAAVWDAHMGEPLAAYGLRKLVGPVGAVAVAPDGLTAFAGGTRGRVVRFDL